MIAILILIASIAAALIFIPIFSVITIIVFVYLILKPIDNFFRDKETQSSKINKTNTKKKRKFTDGWLFWMILYILCWFLYFLAVKFQIGNPGIREAGARGLVGGFIFYAIFYPGFYLWDLLSRKIFNPKNKINESTFNKSKTFQETEKKITPVMENNDENNKIYQQIGDELENDIKSNGLWARSIAEADGDLNKAKSIYIKLRFNELSNENIKFEELKRSK